MSEAAPEPDPQGEVARLRAYFATGATRSIRWRRGQLAMLRTMLASESAALLDAMATDLGRPTLESWITDIWLVDREIALAERRVAWWARSRAIFVSLIQRPGHARTRWEPHGVSLVIAPWNYPVQLTLLPLASALAAGNCVVVKPSELAPATAALLAELLPHYLSPRAVAVVSGGAQVTTDAITAPVDHVFFTGSAVVGRKILETAAPQLTPVTLELGGKSPAIVTTDADLDIAARRIIFGKFVNAGQSCVAPDYILVERNVAAALVERLTAAIAEFYGPDPALSPDYGRIVDDRHLQRLRDLLEASDGHVLGGTVGTAERYLAPTLVLDPSPESPIMCEEIFGPILPLLTVEDTDAAIAFVEMRAAPLVIYAFTSSAQVARRIERSTTSGAFCQNTTIEQLAVTGLPFGGVGASGTGSSHGRAGFETFSRRKSVLLRRSSIDPGLGNPPYSPRRVRALRFLLRGPRGSMPGVVGPTSGHPKTTRSGYSK